QNRELDVMRDISNTFGVSARVDRYERVFAAVGRLLPESAMVIIEWLDGVGAEEPFAVHRSSRVTATRREILEWARRQRLDERAVDPAADSAETVSGLRRDLALAADGSYQVRLRLSTFEMHSGLLIVESASSELHTAESLASLRTIAEHIALVLQDRSIRAQV